MWESLANVIKICNDEKTDLLLIAGDLFHRQPLLRELKAVNELFEELIVTKVVLIAGNHDYVKASSFYRKFKWCENVYSLMGEQLKCVEFPELETCVYGFSYGQKEITEPLFDRCFAMGRQPIEILLGHGGDKNHVPFKKHDLLNLGYDYVALGHIHRPAEVAHNQAYFSGSLEPTDINDTGAHGFIRGEIKNGKVKVQFVPSAMREYIHMELEVSEHMTGRELRNKIGNVILEHGVANIYKFILTGMRDPEREYDLDGMDMYGNIVEFIDQTHPAYDYGKIASRNEDNLLGKFILNMQGNLQNDIGQQALAEGVSALLDSIE